MTTDRQTDRQTISKIGPAAPAPPLGAFPHAIPPTRLQLRSTGDLPGAFNRITRTGEKNCPTLPFNSITSSSPPFGGAALAIGPRVAQVGQLGGGWARSRLSPHLPRPGRSPGGAFRAPPGFPPGRGDSPQPPPGGSLREPPAGASSRFTAHTTVPGAAGWVSVRTVHRVRVACSDLVGVGGGGLRNSRKRSFFARRSIMYCLYASTVEKVLRWRALRRKRRYVGRRLARSRFRTRP